MYDLRNLGNFRGVGLEVGICGTPDTSSMRAGLKTESLKAKSRFRLSPPTQEVVLGQLLGNSLSRV